MIKIEGSLEEAGCIIASPERRLGASQQLSKTSWCCCTRRATGPEHCQWGRLVQPGQGLCQNSRADRPGCRAYHNTGAHKVPGSSQNSRQADQVAGHTRAITQGLTRCIHQVPGTSTRLQGIPGPYNTRAHQVHVCQVQGIRERSQIKRAEMIHCGLQKSAMFQKVQL